MPTKKYTKKKQPINTNTIKTIVKRQLTTFGETKMRQCSNLLTDFGSIGAEWINIPLTNITPGTEYYNRVGSKILLKSIEFRGVLVAGADETAFDDEYSIVRILLTRWDGATTNPFSTIQGHSMGIPINRVIANAPEMKNKYYDRYITLNVSCTERGGGDGYAASARTVYFKKVFKKGIPITYSGAQTSDKFFLSMISDSSLVPNPGFATGYCMITWKDC